MISEIDGLLSRYECGEMTRETLLDALAALAVASPVAVADEPEVGAVQQLNHVTVFVQDVQKSVTFYQRLLGMPVLTRQGRGVNLRAGRSFLGIYPAQERPTGIHHVCFGLESFDAEAVLEKLARAGVRGRILRRGDTQELYFDDPDSIRVQLQDLRYRGGIGPLGDRDPQ